MKKINKTTPPELVTLKVDKETHARVKQYCVENEYWIHLFVEKVLNDYMDKNKPNNKLKP
jgi:DNA-dependent RNA polymerase auxiliary subunit epsilon